MNPYEEAIVRIVNIRPGITSVDLSLAVMNIMNPIKFEVEDYAEAIKAVIKSNRIQVYVFEVPNVTQPIKSVYFPQGISLRNAK